MTEPGTTVDTQSTDRLLNSLVDDAQPVRRIYPLVRVAIGVAVAYVICWAIGVHWMAGDGTGKALGEALTDGFFVGLVTSLAGATGHALACREPGREGAARVSWALLAMGVVATGVTFVVRSGDHMGALSLHAEMQCAEHAIGLGLVPAAVLLFVVFGGWRGRPLAASVAAAVSGVSLGALMVQMTCPSDGAWHVMLGHYVVPLAAGAALAAICVWCWRRFAQR